MSLYNCHSTFSNHMQIICGFVQGQAWAFGLVLVVVFGARIWLGAGTTYAQSRAIYTHHFSNRWRWACIVWGPRWADMTSLQPNSKYCICSESSYMNLFIGHPVGCCSTDSMTQTWKAHDTTRSAKQPVSHPETRTTWKTCFRKAKFVVSPPLTAANG